MNYLTGPEAATHRQQIRELKCAACLNRERAGSYAGEVIWSCTRNLRWPRKGWCYGFRLDEGGE